MEGTYKGEGRFNLLKLTAKGQYNISASEFHLIFLCVSISFILVVSHLGCIYFFSSSWFIADINVLTKVAGIFEERNGEVYLRVKRFDMAPTSIGSMKVHFSGLFPDEELSKL